LVRAVTWLCEERCCIDTAESWAVRSANWACSVDRAFCVMARSARRVARSSEGLVSCSLPLVGVLVRSLEGRVWDCASGWTAMVVGGGCLKSCAVRSARAVSTYYINMLALL
jgi:hypothetical protein